ncbi:hypothetical protein BHM03_00024863 [Ensete ventricosum]|nr:hypothetical protein BHM03_00024863 [Ensete ventricosum]
MQRSSTLHKATREVEFRSIFRAPSRKFKILAIHYVLAHAKSYEHGFMKKCNGHKLYAKSRAKSCFIRYFVHCLRIQNTSHKQVQGKSYSHDFSKNFDGHKLYVKSRAKYSFDRFFMHRHGNSKYWPFLTY